MKHITTCFGCCFAATVCGDITESFVPTRYGKQMIARYQCELTTHRVHQFTSLIYTNTLNSVCSLIEPKQTTLQINYTIHLIIIIM